MTVPIVSDAECALFRGWSRPATIDDWGDAERAAYRDEAAFSRAYSRWLAADLGTPQEAEAWREVARLDRARRADRL